MDISHQGPGYDRDPYAAHHLQAVGAHPSGFFDGVLDTVKNIASQALPVVLPVVRSVAGDACLTACNSVPPVLQGPCRAACGLVKG